MRRSIAGHVTATVLTLAACQTHDPRAANTLDSPQVRLGVPAPDTGLVVATAATQSSPRADDLRRQADWGAGIRSHGPQPGATVVHVAPDGAAATAGLLPNDRIVAVNGVAVATETAFEAARRRTRAGDLVKLDVERDSHRLEISFRPPGRAREQVDGLAIEYGSAVLPAGYRVRTLVTRPAAPARTGGRPPGLLVVPWLSCDSVEILQGPSGGMDTALADVIRHTGFVTLRVEKPGLGDSEGPDCSENDLETDLAAYRAGLEALLARPDVDPERVFVFGLSLGGALGPMVASGRRIRGFVAVNTVGETWYEHMLALERRRLALSGRPPGEVAGAMGGYARLYAGILLDGRTPAEMIAARPELKPLWTDEAAHQYGRPVRFYQQVQARNPITAWEAHAVPTLVVHGEYDWIMSRADAEAIVSAVNTKRPGAATLQVVPKADHGLETYPSAKAAFAGRGGSVDAGAGAAIVRWLRAQAGE